MNMLGHNPTPVPNNDVIVHHDVSLAWISALPLMPIIALEIPISVFRPLEAGKVLNSTRTFTKTEGLQLDNSLFTPCLLI